MKTGLTTSVVLHAAVLGFGLISLSAPRPFEVLDMESLPVDLVPVESITQIQQGDKKATVNEKPTPKPTEKTETVPDAEKVGENKVDTDKKATPEITEKQVEAAAMPKEAPKPEPKPVDQPKPDPVVEPEPKTAAVPATEVMPQPEPKQEVKPDPVSEAIAANETQADAIELPTEAPAPEAKPKPPQAQTAKTPDRKEAEKPVKQAAATPKSEEKQFDADEVAALLNKEKAFGRRRQALERDGFPRRREDDGRLETFAERDGRVARPGPALLEHSRRSGRRRGPARVGEVQARPFRRVGRQPRDHRRRRQRWRRTRRGRGSAPRRLALRPLQSSRREI